jgi:hypothetical protein
VVFTLTIGLALVAAFLFYIFGNVNFAGLEQILQQSLGGGSLGLVLGYCDEIRG